MSTAKPHGMPESGAPEKYPKPAAGGTRGPWPKGGNFWGNRTGALPVGVQGRSALPAGGSHNYESEESLLI